MVATTIRQAAVVKKGGKLELKTPELADGTRVEVIVLVTEPAHQSFTATIETDGDWYIASCPEVPGANGQGRTPEECKANLAEAIALILEDQREDQRRRNLVYAVQELLVTA